MTGTNGFANFSREIIWTRGPKQKENMSSGRYRYEDSISQFFFLRNPWQLLAFAMGIAISKVTQAVLRGSLHGGASSKVEKAHFSAACKKRSGEPHK